MTTELSGPSNCATIILYFCYHFALHSLEQLCYISPVLKSPKYPSPLQSQPMICMLISFKRRKGKGEEEKEEDEIRSELNPVCN